MIWGKCLCRNLCNFLIPCRIGRMRPFSLSSPRLWIAEGLLYEDAWVWNFVFFQVDTSRVAVKKIFVVCSSVWIFDKGKLMLFSIKFHYCEAVEKCRIQEVKVGRKARNDSSKVTTFSVAVSPFTRVFQVSHWYALAAEMCSAWRMIFEEREEDLIPVGMVNLTFG